jgi:hypothetical protein
MTDSASTSTAETTDHNAPTLDTLRSRFRDPATGQFDPGRLPLLAIEDKDGNSKLYLAVAWRLNWWNHDHPLGDPIRISTEVVEHAQTPHVIAQIIDVRIERYLRDPDGKISVIPGADGTAQAALNPAHILYADRKMITSSRRGDPTEKALTGAIGRVLGRAGYGTEGALELLEDEDDMNDELDERNEIVDSPHDRPSGQRNDRASRSSGSSRGDADRNGLLESIFKIVDAKNIGDGDLREMAKRIGGPDATSDSLTAAQLREVLTLVEGHGATANETPSASNARPHDNDGRRERPRRSSALPNDSSANEAEVARKNLIALQDQLGLSNEDVIEAIRKVKAPDPYEPGDALHAMDYIAASRELETRNKAA